MNYFLEKGADLTILPDGCCIEKLFVFKKKGNFTFEFQIPVANTLKLI